jgi:FkbM family methyltransferase
MLASKSREDVLSRISKVIGFVPSGLGAHAAARKIISRSQPMPRMLLRQKLSGGAVVELDMSDAAQAEAYLTRRYEPNIVAALARFLPQRSVFFDVGANIGLITFSLGVRRRDVSIVAFEPDPANAHHWRRNRQLNPDVAAVLEEVALGRKEGEAGLVRGDVSAWSFIGEPGLESDVKVRVVTLDAYAQARQISSIGGLKVDVEGYEPRVFEGAASLLKKRAIRFVVCELEETLLERSGFTRREVISLLSRYGYTVRPIPPVAGQRLRLHRRSLEASRDVLFVPE